MKNFVFDTNILISGLLWDGNEAFLIEKAEGKEIKLFTSHPILKELEEVLKREKFSKKLKGGRNTVEKAVAKIALMATLVESGRRINIVKEDPADNRVLECAVAAGASAIVSGDHHLLRLATFEGIEILTALEVMNKMNWVRCDCE